MKVKQYLRNYGKRNEFSQNEEFASYGDLSGDEFILRMNRLTAKANPVPQATVVLDALRGLNYDLGTNHTCLESFYEFLTDKGVDKIAAETFIDICEDIRFRSSLETVKLEVLSGGPSPSYISSASLWMEKFKLPACKFVVNPRGRKYDKYLIGIPSLDNTDFSRVVLGGGSINNYIDAFGLEEVPFDDKDELIYYRATRNFRVY